MECKILKSNNNSDQINLKNAQEISSTLYAVNYPLLAHVGPGQIENELIVSNLAKNVA